MDLSFANCTKSENGLLLSVFVFRKQCLYQGPFRFSGDSVLCGKVPGVLLKNQGSQGEEDTWCRVAALSWEALLLPAPPGKGELFWAGLRNHRLPGSDFTKLFKLEKISQIMDSMPSPE